MTPSFNPPTDSLYKFMAITGTLMIVVAYLATDAEVRSLRDFESRESQATIGRLDQLNWRMIDGVRLDHPEKAERGRELRVVQPQFEEMRDTEIGKLKDRVDAARRDLKSNVWCLNIIEKIGFILAPVGFLLWWRRIQIPLDRILWAEYRSKCPEYFKESKRTSKK